MAPRLPSTTSQYIRDRQRSLDHHSTPCESGRGSHHRRHIKRRAALLEHEDGSENQGYTDLILRNLRNRRPSYIGITPRKSLSRDGKRRNRTSSRRRRYLRRSAERHHHEGGSESICSSPSESISSFLGRAEGDDVYVDGSDDDSCSSGSIDLEVLRRDLWMDMV